MAFAGFDLLGADGVAGVIDPTDLTRSDKIRTGYAVGGGIEHSFWDG